MKRTVAVLLLCLTVIGLAGCVAEKETPPEELRTPQYSIELTPKTDSPEFSEIPAEEIHSAGSVKTVGEKKEKQEVQADVASAYINITPDEIWEEDSTVTYNGFTLPERAAFSGTGNIGVLSIPSLKLVVNVYEAEDEMEAMSRGAAHFKSTSAWDGNIGISAHNVNMDGSEGYFKNLYTLAVGDLLTYETALGSRSYAITKINNISAEDWSSLSRSAENKITLITCISGQPDKRLMIQAVEQ